MDLLEAIYKRRSIRQYKDKNIPSNVVQDILKAGVQAPSSCNQQMYYFILVTDVKLKKKLHIDAGFKWIDRIPLPIFVICDKRFGNERYANIQGASASIQNMMLYAHSIGIGSCWMAGYGDKAVVKRLLNIPQHFHILGCVGFGYSDEKPLAPVKRPVEDITFYNKFMDVKNTNNPDEWEYKEILGLAERAIAAKSPDIGYYHLFSLELEQQLKYISSKLGKNNLYIYDVGGIYLFRLAQMNQDKEFTMLSYSKNIHDWMVERTNYLKIKNIKFIVGKLSDIKSKTFDTILFIDLINRLPHKNRLEILNESKRIVKSNGNIILSFLNKFSLYGILFNKGVARRYGPEISLSHGYIKSLLKDNDLNVTDSFGFNLIPSPRLFFKIGVPGRYTLFNDYLRGLSKLDLLEDYKTDNFLKNFCTSMILNINSN